jgi:hypothetical protein
MNSTIEAQHALTPEQQDSPRDNIPTPMTTEVVKRDPMTALEKLKDELKSARNLDVGFETADFNIDQAIDLVMELDKYTKTSVFNSWKFFLNMQCIRQALRILPDTDIEKTSDGREQYDQLIAHTMDEYEKEGDYATKLPAFIALNEKLRVLMYDDGLDPSPMSDTLEFMCRTKPTAENFERDYDERVRQGQRPGISKRQFCELQLQDALRQHDTLVERGQAAIEFCNDLNVHTDRGHGDLPDWAVDAIYTKCIDKLTQRWGRLDIRRTALSTPMESRTEAQADQTLIEFVFETLTGRQFVTEY